MNGITTKWVSVIGSSWLLSIAAPLAAASAPAKCDVNPVFEFSSGAAEGLAISTRGDIFVGNINTGEIWFAPRGDFSRASLRADLVASANGFTFVLGMDVAKDNALYVAVNSFFNTTLHGLWRIDEDGTATLAAPFPSSFETLLNDVAIDQRGNVYVSDSLGGRIWRLTPSGDLDVWSDSAMLQGGFHPGLNIPFGVNGITYHQGAVYAAIYLEGRIVRVPIADDGSAGDPENVIVDAALIGADGIAIDATGDLYVSVNDADMLVRIDGRDLRIEPLIFGLSAPASLAVTPDRKTVYIANLSVSAPDPHPYAPAVMAATLCRDPRKP